MTQNELEIFKLLQRWVALKKNRQVHLQMRSYDIDYFDEQIELTESEMANWLVKMKDHQ